MDSNNHTHTRKAIIYGGIIVVAVVVIVSIITRGSNFGAFVEPGTTTNTSTLTLPPTSTLSATTAAFFNDLTSAGVSDASQQKFVADLQAYLDSIPSTTVDSMNTTINTVVAQIKSDPAYVPGTTSGPVIDKYLLPNAQTTYGPLQTQIATLITNDIPIPATTSSNNSSTTTLQSYTGGKASIELATATACAVADDGSTLKDLPPPFNKWGIFKGCKIDPTKRPPFNNGCLLAPNGDCFTGGNFDPIGPVGGWFPRNGGGLGFGGGWNNGHPVPVICYGKGNVSICVFQHGGGISIKF